MTTPATDCYTVRFLYRGGAVAEEHTVPIRDVLHGAARILCGRFRDAHGFTPDMTVTDADGRRIAWAER